MIAALPLSVSAAGEYVPAQLLLGDDVVESKAVEIDTYLFFTNDVVTRPQEEYTIRVRARWIMIVGDPDGQYMVADVGEAEPPHEHSYTQKHDAAQHWQECSCGERLNVANHTLFCLAASAGDALAIWDLMVQFIMPVNVTACICLTCLYFPKVKSQAFPLALSLCFAGLWQRLVTDETGFQSVSAGTWILGLTVSVIYLCTCVKFGQQQLGKGLDGTYRDML